MSDNTINLSLQEMNFLNSLPKKPSQLDKEAMMVSEIQNLVAALVNNDPKLDELIQNQAESATQEFNARAENLGLPNELSAYKIPAIFMVHGSRLSKSGNDSFLASLPNISNALVVDYFEGYLSHLSKTDNNSFLITIPNIGNETQMVANYFEEYLAHWNSRIYSGQTTPYGTIIPIPEDSLKARIKELEENSARFFCYAKDRYSIEGNNLDELVRFIKFEVSRNILSLQEKNAEYSLNWIAKRFSTVYDEVAQIDCSDLTTNETIAFRTKQICRNIAESNSTVGLSLDNAGDFEDSIAAYVRKRLQHELDLKSKAQYILQEKEYMFKDIDLKAKPFDLLDSIKAKMAAFTNPSSRKNTGPSGPN